MLILKVYDLNASVCSRCEAFAELGRLLKLAAYWCPSNRRQDGGVLGSVVHGPHLLLVLQDLYVLEPICDRSSWERVHFKELGLAILTFLCPEPSSMVRLPHERMVLRVMRSVLAPFTLLRLRVRC